MDERTNKSSEETLDYKLWRMHENCHDWQAINQYDEWPEGLGLEMTGIECFIASQLLLRIE